MRISRDGWYNFLKRFLFLRNEMKREKIIVYILKCDYLLAYLTNAKENNNCNLNPPAFVQALNYCLLMLRPFFIKVYYCRLPISVDSLPAPISNKITQHNTNKYLLHPNRFF